MADDSKCNNELTDQLNDQSNNQSNNQSGNFTFACSVLQHLQPGVWLPLEQPPSCFADSEALLLCQLSQFEWLTWVPNHGEYYLRLHQDYPTAIAAIAIFPFQGSN